MRRSHQILLIHLFPLLGCRPDPPANPGSHTQEPRRERWTGIEPDEGFGSALAVSEHGAWTGAPHGTEGRVYCLDSSGVVETIRGEGRLGSTLTTWGTGFLGGAPLAGSGEGRLIDQDGEIIASGPRSLGIALTSDASRWVAAHGSGWVDSHGQAGSIENRPASIAVSGERLAIGTPNGDSPLWLDGTTFTRADDFDFAGYAMVAGDIDGDGNDEWFVGSPGSNRVEVRTRDGERIHTLLGSAERFGASLSLGDLDGDGLPELAVGAPAAGERAQGSVWVYSTATWEIIEQWSGEEAGDQLGTALTIHDQSLWIGIPGAPEGLGSVWRVEID